MKCPHCKYEEYIIDKDGLYIEGKEGGFFCLPIQIERRIFDSCEERRRVYGCPKCRKLFMSDH